MKKPSYQRKKKEQTDRKGSREARPGYGFYALDQLHQPSSLWCFVFFSSLLWWFHQNTFFFPFLYSTTPVSSSLFLLFDYSATLSSFSLPTSSLVLCSQHFQVCFFLFLFPLHFSYDFKFELCFCFS